MGLYEGVDGVNKRGLAAYIFDAVCIHACGVDAKGDSNLFGRRAT